MISMTGYGYRERQDDEAQVAVEVKSVNNRYLDINVSLPASLNALEAAVRERVGAAVLRGRVEVYVRARDLASPSAVSLDRAALAGYRAALEELHREPGDNAPVTAAELLGFDGVLRVEKEQDRERFWELVLPLLDEAIAEFAESRRSEGAKLRSDIQAQLTRVDRALETIAANAGEIESQIRTTLRSRFNEVLGDAVDEARLLSEVAVQLVRFSINEEIVRLGAHLSSFRATLGDGAAVGKKLDFICQEMHREINTIGSKSTTLPVSAAVVEAKDALENLREQLRNVE